MPITGKPKSVEISFGTLFSVRELGEEIGKINVIIDVGGQEKNLGEEDYFHVGCIGQDEHGNRLIKSYGTDGPESFGEIVGQMSLKEIIEAARRGDQTSGYGFTDEQRFRELARKGSRRLLLDR